eukprot:1117874-Prymnesium_polylepis.1
MVAVSFVPLALDSTPIVSELGLLIMHAARARSQPAPRNRASYRTDLPAHIPRPSCHHAITPPRHHATTPPVSYTHLRAHETLMNL